MKLTEDCVGWAPRDACSPYLLVAFGVADLGAQELCGSVKRICGLEN